MRASYEHTDSTLAQAALLRAARSIRPRTGRGDAVPSGDEGAGQRRSRNGADGSAVCGAAAIRQSNTTSGGESRYVGSQIDRDAFSGRAIRRADADEKSRV